MYDLPGTLKVSYVCCSGLSLVISAQFTFEMCVAARNSEKFTELPYFRGARSYKVIDVNTLKKLVTSACCDKQHICTYQQPFLR